MQKTVCFTTSQAAKVNQYDAQAMLGGLRAPRLCRGTRRNAPADVYVVNTCTVTGTGDKREPAGHPRCRRKPDARSWWWPAAPGASA